MSASAISPGEIDALIDRELDQVDTLTPVGAGLLREFQAARRRPKRVTVNFSGGITQSCWTVTKSDGDYQVIYLPRAGYFSLCVASAFGPLDIGVHGRAIECFGSV